MPLTAMKRHHPETVDTDDIRPHKFQRSTVADNIHVQPAQQTPVYPNELWDTICKTDIQSLREIVYHATMANIDPQVSLRVLNMHHTRIHNEAVQAEQARKTQELRDKRDRKKVIDFDQHFRQIDSWVSNDPIDRKACRISYGIYEKIVARIAKLTEKAIEATTNFQSKCNALETLRKIVDAILRHSDGAMGIEIYGYFNTERDIENSMLRILHSMDPPEHAELLNVRDEGVRWIEQMETLETFRQTKEVHFGRHEGEAPFPGISEVLDFVLGAVKAEASEGGVLLKKEPAVE
ncbi:hypothetical protein AC578_3083 [Pseudocercospora eumusae]|uniref:Uncharacterized protein n=1 Tax=Pseudocercospora eumusae TaxID=321146 RepID=A0A139H1V3_9PEZI|nr:hypothetical protein AC578_3083 [Pseudocercospora eumusae]